MWFPNAVCLQKWDEFICSSEEKQQQVINEGKEKKCNLSRQSDSPEISAALRRLLRRKSFPTGILQYLEEELVGFFLEMPTKTYISRELSSFERLLLHSLSDYHRLISVSKSRKFFPSTNCSGLSLSTHSKFYLACRLRFWSGADKVG